MIKSMQGQEKMQEQEALHCSTREQQASMASSARQN